MKKLILISLSILFLYACDVEDSTKITVSNKSQQNVTNLNLISTDFDTTILPDTDKIFPVTWARGSGSVLLSFGYDLGGTRFSCPTVENIPAVEISGGELVTIVVFDNGYEIKNSAGKIIGEWKS
jgi:hypothetical protein